MPTSILIDTKKVLGLDANDKSFDADIIMFINAALGVVTQLGLGPTEGFAITGDDEEWEDLEFTIPQLNVAQAYVYFKVRLAFDPPATSFHLEAAKQQVEEYEWRLNQLREELIVWP